MGVIKKFDQSMNTDTRAFSATTDGDAVEITLNVS